MTRRAWLILAWGILILTIFDGAYLVKISSYSVNAYTDTEGKNNRGPEGLRGPLYSIGIEVFDRIDSFTAEHEKLLVVGATLAIAFFTFTLWRSTSGLVAMAQSQARDLRKSIAIAKTSADAATATAKAILGVELPTFIIVRIGMKHSKDLEMNIDVTVEVQNHGRTAAVITQDCLVSTISNELPPEPHYTIECQQQIDFGRVVKEDALHLVKRGIRLSDEDENRIRNRKTTLWVHGYIAYTDFLKDRHITGFVAAFRPNPVERDIVHGTFYQEGPETYTYSKYESRDKTVD